MTILARKTMVSVILLSGAIGLAGCETTGGNNAATKGIMGAAAGAIVGSIIGNNAGDGDGQSGALIGAVIGGAGGAYMGCREDGGCGADQQSKPYEYGASRPVYEPDASINRRQFFDNKTGRYYYYDPATRQEYYENGTRKYK